MVLDRWQCKLPPFAVHKEIIIIIIIIVIIVIMQSQKSKMINSLSVRPPELEHHSITVIP